MKNLEKLKSGLFSTINNNREEGARKAKGNARASR